MIEDVVQPRSSVWLIEPRYTTVQFKAKFAFFPAVVGQFRDLSGVIVRDESDLHASSVEATIKSASINSGNERRDRHLRSKDFLDVEHYPEFRYVSSSVVKGRDRDTLRVSGLLTVRGKSREVVLDVTEVERSQSPQGAEVAYFSAQTVIDRHDFGVSWLRFVIRRKVKVVIHVQAVRQ